MRLLTVVRRGVASVADDDFPVAGNRLGCDEVCCRLVAGVSRRIGCVCAEADRSLRACDLRLSGCAHRREFQLKRRADESQDLDIRHLHPAKYLPDRGTLDPSNSGESRIIQPETPLLHPKNLGDRRRQRTGRSVRSFRHTGTLAAGEDIRLAAVADQIPRRRSEQQIKAKIPRAPPVRARRSP